MATPFILMLKTIVSSERLILKQLGVNDGKINRFGINGSKKITRKSEKLFKSQKSAKSRKKLSKSGNLSNFTITKAGLKFLTSNTNTAFNYLQLAFIKALIL